MHQLEALVAGKQRGDSPEAAPKPEARRHALRFEICAETFSIFREAVDKVRRDSGGSLDDDSTLMQDGATVLGAPTDEGRSSYQLALSVWPTCRQGCQQSSGELAPIDAHFVAMAECDAQHLDLSFVDADPVDSVNGSGSTATANKTANETLDAPGTPRAAHAGADTSPTMPRANQSVRPGMRRAVLRRDHHRCRAPGCQNRRFVEVHHVRLPSEDGPNRPSNLVTLCSFHHLAVHRGRLTITGSAPDALSFRHADGSTYGTTPDAQAVAAHTKVFAALRRLGSREGEARRALVEVATRIEGRLLPADAFLRGALVLLTSPKGTREGR